ncbi:hypothetical protein QUB05_31815 [Microcoleus sp. F10-C6]
MKAAKLEIGVLRLSCCEARGRRKEPEEVFLPHIPQMWVGFLYQL